MMIKILLPLLSAVLLALLLSSCSIQKRCAALYPAQTDTLVAYNTDTVTREVITIRDVPVYLLGDSVVIHDTIKGNTDYHGHTKGRLVNAEVWLRNGVLDVKCKTDSLITALARVGDTLREMRANSQKVVTIRVTRTIPREVIKKRIPAIFWYLLAFNVVYFGWKYWLPLKSAGLKLIPKLLSLFK